MASLITSEERAILTGTFQDVFDTFKRDIVVYKEPIQIVETISESMIFGYGEYSNPVNYTNSLVSGSFSATIRYQDMQEEDYSSLLGADLTKGIVRIKVQKAAKDFIDVGKTEKIEFDDKTFNVVSDVAVKRFLDSEYFVYYLQATN
tara:strand:+ start:253 stop:693 length:441 start_codon:yes stop_codon:yes gene_type:complete